MKAEKEIIKDLTAAFEEWFSGSPAGSASAGVFFAPGRINLIGEHIDYNGGHVLPCALSLGTYAAAAKRDDDRIRLYSENFAGAGVLEFSVPDCGGGRLPEAAKDSWAAYLLGVVCALADKGICIGSGFDMAVLGNLPSGAGLSSSASLEVLTAYTLRCLFGFELENKEIALICQRAENEYCGMRCGIMDQFAVAMAKEGSAIYLNTDTLEYEHVPLELAGARLVISNTNKKHKLAGSAYNDRRSECGQAFELLSAAAENDRPEGCSSGQQPTAQDAAEENSGSAAGAGPARRTIKCLCDITPEMFEKYKTVLKDPVLAARAKHAVYENERTKEAAAALKAGDLERIGQLMCEAHVSISRDFEVSCMELDILQEEAMKIPGVYGSRMSGGGFGGCTVSIVKEEAVPEFIEKVGAAYLSRVGYAADFYIVSPSGGPRIICSGSAGTFRY